MRNMTPEELEEMWNEIAMKMQDEIKKIQSYTLTVQASPFHIGTSPTDVEARGMYEYQEPEVDEQGTYYGYKILNKHCNHPDCDILVSPRYTSDWTNGELQATMPPSEKSMFGIHCTKRPDHPELRNYVSDIMGNIYSYAIWDIPKKSVLVKCALSGTIVETEQGFRAEHAQIVGVLVNGNWKSYQDYQECAKGNSRPNPYQEEEWKADYRFTYGKSSKGNRAIYYTDFSADS